MDVHTFGSKNLLLTSATLISGFIARITASEAAVYITIAVGIATLISYIQKIYYNWELRRNRKRKQDLNNKQL